MVRLFADENFPLPVVEALRQIGHDVLTIQEAGMANQGFSVRRYWNLPVTIIALY